MSDFTIDACRSCSAPIIWTTSEKGSAAPIDAEPVADGTIAIDDRGTSSPLSRVLPPMLRFGRTDLHKSHFVTCPQAKTWRARKRGAS